MCRVKASHNLDRHIVNKLDVANWDLLRKIKPKSLDMLIQTASIRPLDQLKSQACRIFFEVIICCHDVGVCMHVEPGLQVFVVGYPVENKFFFEVIMENDEAFLCQNSFNLV